MSETTTEPTVEPDAELEPDEALEPSPIDEELEPELEPEADAGEPEAAEQPSTQALLQALESEERRHAKAIAKALNVELEELHSCPTCDGIGYTPEAIDAPPPLVQDPFTETCSRCQGNGETLSGATSRGLYAIPCNGCSGSGYVTKQEQPAAGLSLTETVYVPPPAVSSPTPSPEDAAMLAAIRARGYMVLDPITVPPASSS